MPLPKLVGLAISAAFYAASYFLRPSQNSEQGKVENIPIQQSEYGGLVQLFWGTVRIGGNIVWASQLEQRSSTESAKGGPKVTTFTYFTDFAVMLGERRIRDVLKIWADGKVIFDRANVSDPVQSDPHFEDEDAPGSLFGPLFTSVTAESGLNFRIYHGSETQEPDTLIQADVDGKYGAGSTPAYRGRSYIVFEDFALTNFGNRIPNLTFEVVAENENPGGPVSPLSVTVSPTDLDFNTSPVNISLDSDRGLVYYLDNTSSVPVDINGVDLDVIDVLVSGITPATVFLSPRHNRLNERTGFLRGLGGNTLGFNSDYHIVDSTTFTTVVTSPAATPNDARRLESGGAVASQSSGGVNYDAYVFLNNNSVSSRGIYIRGHDMGILEEDVTGDDLGNIEVGESIGAGAHIRSPVVGTGADGRHAYAMIGADDPSAYDSILLYAVGINTDDAGMALFDDYADEDLVDPVPVSLKHGVRDTFIPADFGLTEFGPSDTTKEIALVYDRQSQALLVFVRGDAAGSYKCGKWTRTDGIVGVLDVPSMPQQGHHAYASGAFAWCTPATDSSTKTKVCLLHISEFRLDDVLDGESTESQLTAGDWGLASFGDAIHAVWDSRRFSLYGLEGGDKPYRIHLGSAEAEGVTLANIVEDLCVLSGLQSGSDIDVSELVDTTVQGYVVAGQQTSRASIQPLSDMYFFDGVESDYKLRFLDRGRASSLTLEEDDFVVSGDDAERSYTQTRVQESEIPTSVQFTYLDPGNEYQVGAQQASRVLVPRPTVRSNNQQTIETPIVVDSNTARQTAEKTLFTRWNEREGFEFKYGFGGLRLDPCDVILMNLNNSRQVRLRLDSSDVGADLSIEMRGVQEAANQYVSTIVGQGGNALEVTPVTTRPSTLFLMDMPFIRDTDDPGVVAPLMYWAAGMSGSVVFPGAVLYESLDLSSYDDISSTNVAASWGRLTEALPAPASPWTWDRVNSITLSVGQGADQFESADEIDVLTGVTSVNGLAIIRSNGEVEIIQFADVEIIGTNRVRLTNLLRGRRGTEVFADEAHAVGSLAVLLTESSLRSFTDAVFEIGQAHSYKLVSIGRTLEATTAQAQTPDGRSLRPYAPVQLKATLDGSDIDLTAERRTRLNGELMDGSGVVPLNEESEAYELDIFDTDGETVLRTITGLTSPAYTYLDADITTDFGGAIVELTVAWYQISATVGRGFPGKATIEVL